MLIRIRGPHEPLPSELTSPAVWKRRREILGAALGGVGLGLSSGVQAQFARSAPPVPVQRTPLAGIPSPLSTQEKVTPYSDVTTYNNFFEFGTEKDEPARHAHRMPIRPWSVAVEGEVQKPGRFDIEDLLKLAPLEERIYRLRCVEGWSMVIPWVGFPLAELIRRVQPTGNARYVAFETLVDRAVMPGVRSPSTLEWPYREGLRLDEAMHPLTLLTFGLFGEVLPNQNGAPIRLVVPWKYGFKSIKSLVRIQFVEKQPVTSWSLAQPREYGFYSNVNPAVSHPRWSQATERRIGEDGVFARKRPTLPFNGYADQVASLYAGMDLARFY